MTATQPPGFTPDPYAQAGKWRAPSDHVEILVIGAGLAGTAAAIAAARGGISVLLVDENPVSSELIGMDVPLFFGGRAGAAVQNKPRMLEQVLATNPSLEEAFEAGVDVQLGTCCWGVFRNGPGLQTLPGPVAGLCDDVRTWLVSFDRVILATGARDLVVSFQGSDQPGVMGAQAFAALAERYDAFDGRSVLILGTGELALEAADLATRKGIEVAGLVEVRETGQGDAGRIEALRARGVPVLTGHVIREATRGPFGVSAAVLAPLGSGLPAVVVACDTIVLAIDRVPVVDLADVAGVKLALDATRGGYVPVPIGSEAGETPVLMAGDCAGLVSPEEARAQGHAAGLRAMAALRPGSTDPGEAPTAAPQDRQEYRLDWMRAFIETGGPDVIACQCEDVTRAELLGVRPPRYLGPHAHAFANRSLLSLAQDGPVDQDHIKRLTRACMGPCQARRCREQVAMVLALGSTGNLEDVVHGRYRSPVRPLPLGVLAEADEHEAMQLGWDVWFGIPTQWVPYDDIGTEREAAFRHGWTRIVAVLSRLLRRTIRI